MFNYFTKYVYLSTNFNWVTKSLESTYHTAPKLLASLKA